MYNNPELVEVIKSGKLAVIPTDTIYGIVARAEDKKAVDRLQTVRRNDNKKPFIILISNKCELEKFLIKPADYHETIKKYWPGPVSIIFPCNDKRLRYLHLGTKSLAFRLPDSTQFRQFLSKTGPLVAPSANLPGKDPAIDIGMARQYFGKQVDYYLDAGGICGNPSKLISLMGLGEEVLR